MAPNQARLGLQVGTPGLRLRPKLLRLHPPRHVPPHLVQDESKSFPSPAPATGQSALAPPRRPQGSFADRRSPGAKARTRSLLYLGARRRPSPVSGAEGAKPRRFLQFQARLGSTGRPSLSESHRAAFLMVHIPSWGWGWRRAWRKASQSSGGSKGAGLRCDGGGCHGPSRWSSPGSGPPGGWRGPWRGARWRASGRVPRGLRFPVEGVQVVRVRPRLVFQGGGVGVWSAACPHAKRKTQREFL